VFIPLDLDKQPDGKLIVGNHIIINSPNGRLPMTVPSNQASQPPQFMPDGGVYQGQSNDWNQTTKVCSRERKTTV